MSRSRTQLDLALRDQLVRIAAHCIPQPAALGVGIQGIVVPERGDPSVFTSLRASLRAIPDVALFMFDHDLRYLFCEGSSLRSHGFGPEAMEGRTLREVLPDAADALEPMYRRALGGETVEFEREVGDTRFSVTAAPIRDAAGRIVGGSLLSVDVTEDGSADETRREIVERLDRIASNVPGAVYQVRVDSEGAVSFTYISYGMRAVTGIDPESLRADPWLMREIIHPDHRDDFDQKLFARRAGTTQSQWEGRAVLADGSVRWLRFADQPHVNGDGSIVRDGVVLDITAQRVAEDTARWQLDHDPLTGLPGRRLFLDRLEQALLETQAGGAVVGVCFVGIDHFKQINDALGYVVGDEALRAISHRIRSCLRTEDTVARHGGDELTVLFPQLPSREFAILLARRIAKACETPVLIGAREVSFSCSIGIAVAPDDGIDASELLARANAAMYRAKDQGRARIEVFNAALARQNEQRLWLERHLRDAITRDELDLVYQPIVDTDGRPTSMEALLRWHPAGHDPVPPDLFIPIAEEIGLIGTIGAWVLKRACETAATWLAAGRPLRVCVNLSPCQLADTTITHTVATTLKATGLPARLLELEVTETALMERGECVAAPLRELRQLGVRISLDDFGTGYSSLARLRYLPLDALKVDASFVAEIGNEFGTAIVKTIIDLGHTLGLDVIGEGVETPEQHHVLTQLGCDLLQGYHLGRPAPDANSTPRNHHAAA